MIDNLVQIAHNVKIGSGNIFCGQVGISGSVKIGDNNVFGGQCGVADHIKIGSGNFFASKAGIGKDVGDNMIMGGIPAVPMQDFHRQVISLRKLAASKDKPQNKKG
jgi:UDP-3-O-[3-hydroxymyristoyl] glucosamine N-acyltransferase